MRIAVIAHIRHPIAAPFRGGMEAHCDLLVRTLVERGHAVTLLASGDSDPSLPLSPIARHHYEASLPWAQWHGSDALATFQRDAFVRAWAAVSAGGFDVVHNNSLFGELIDWAKRDGVPMVTSLHVPPFRALAQAAARGDAPWLRLTATSHAHAAGWAAAGIRPSVVHNGIDLERWRFRARGNGRAVWAGRITPTKGTALAIEAARRAGLALDIVGPIDCDVYWRDEVRPLLDSGRRWHGALGTKAIVEMIGSASVMLATPMWEEPFGLVAAEALACGVPVAAFDRGALREVVGDCGRLATGVDQLAMAARDAMAMDRDRCRARAVRSFSAGAMVAGYEALYAAAVEGAQGSSSDSTRAVLA